MSDRRRLAVFCGASTGTRNAYRDAAAAVGEALARRGVGIVYGGGNVGLMGVLADAALAAGGEVIGIIPDSLLAKELGHRGIQELRVVASMHERKQQMAELSAGFLALPGGFGTYEEILEVITWAQLGIHAKPCGILNVAGFYDPLLAQLERAIADGFIRAEQRALIAIEDDPERAVSRLLTYQPPRMDRWLDREQT